VTDFFIKTGRAGEDPIFALNSEASARAARGESIVNATIGVLLDEDGALAVLPSAAAAVAAVSQNDWAAYAPIAGLPAFLEAVKSDVLRDHPGLVASAVAVATPGGTGAVRHAIVSFLKPGDALLTSSFYWGPYAILAEEHDRRVETFSMFDPQRMGNALNVNALDRKLGEMLAKQGRALLVINDPCHNPTGYSLDAADWAALAEVVGRHAATGPVVVLVDAAYAAYGANGVAPAIDALLPLLGQALILVAWSASKTFTQYGLRVGSLIALVADAAEQQRLQAALSYACRGTWSNCNRGGMTAVARLLSDDSLRAQVSRERAEVVDQLNQRVDAFNALARPRGLRYPRYTGGFFVTVFVDDAFAAAAKMREAGVFVVPQTGALRVALCAVALRNIPRLVDALASVAAPSAQVVTADAVRV
jgi:aromatic-amino-acid transaminase